MLSPDCEECLLMHGIKRWLAFLMFAWGATTIGLGGVKNAASASGVRFVLGTFEAGEYPIFS